jgi:uncharacterized protein
MKLHLAQQTDDHRFTGYGAGYVAVNHTRYEKSLVVMADRVIEGTLPAGVAGLTSSHFEFLLGLDPEIVLLGTGTSLRFPAPELSRCLPAAGVGLESMSTSAACRTYNILIAEGRRVLAAVLID